MSGPGWEPLIYTECLCLLRLGCPPAKLLGHFLYLDLPGLSLTGSDTASPSAGPSFLISPPLIGYSPFPASLRTRLQGGPLLL